MTSAVSHSDVEATVAFLNSDHEPESAPWSDPPADAMRAGDDIATENAGWSFAGEVCKVYDQHVSKSVPLYAEGHHVVAQISDFLIGSNSVCYELGCSTGQLTMQLAERHAHRDARFIAIDMEADMVRQAQRKCGHLSNVSIVEGDITAFEFEPADMVVAYYTMHFVRPNLRQALFRRIYDSLNRGGAFIMFEKVRGSNARFQDIINQLYLDYKLERGYRTEEIIGKMRSLKGVLEPFSEQGNIDLLRRAGFEDVTSIMKYLCFQGFLAIK